MGATRSRGTGTPEPGRPGDALLGLIYGSPFLLYNVRGLVKGKLFLYHLDALCMPFQRAY
jgi:hypothetical protein